MLVKGATCVFTRPQWVNGVFIKFTKNDMEMLSVLLALTSNFYRNSDHKFLLIILHRYIIMWAYKQISIFHGNFDKLLTDSINIYQCLTSGLCSIKINTLWVRYISYQSIYAEYGMRLHRHNDLNNIILSACAWLPRHTTPPYDNQ